MRSDHRGENVDVWQFMVSHHNNESCVTVGSSTHNERIERLWRDVRTSVLKPFTEAFRALESEDNVDPLNDIDLFCLYHIFILQINENVTSFTHSWNKTTELQLNMGEHLCNYIWVV